MALHDLSVRAKLLGGFGILLLLLLLIAGLGLHQMGMLHNTLDDILDNQYAKVHYSKAIEQRSSNVGHHVKSAILAPGSDGVEAAIGRIEADRRENSADMDRLAKLVKSEEGRRLFQNLLNTRDTLSQDYPALYTLLRARDQAHSIEHVNQVFMPRLEAFMQATEGLARHQEEAMDRARQQASQRYATARNLMLGVSGLSLVLGLLFALRLATTIANRIGHAQALARRIAEGDLTWRSEDEDPARDEIGSLRTQLSKMRHELAVTVRTITTAAHQVGDSAAALSTAAGEVATSTERQSQSTASAAASVEELTVSIDHVAASAGDASQRADEAEQLARNGGTQVQEATQGIGEVAEAVSRSAEDIQTLAGSVQRIGSMATVIREVADQTNLLALNAAIEAARAGEQGRGFAVVADEVRKLAERTTASVAEISQTISAIEQGVASAVDSMGHSRARVDRVVSAAREAGNAMGSICGATDAVHGTIGDISTAMQEQRAASTELSRNVEAIAQMSEENAAAVGSVAASSQTLVDVATHLRESVARFRA